MEGSARLAVLRNTTSWCGCFSFIRPFQQPLRLSTLSSLHPLAVDGEAIPHLLLDGMTSAGRPFLIPFERDAPTAAAAIAYFALCGVGAILIVASIITQCLKPAPYGKFANTRRPAPTTTATSTTTAAAGAGATTTTTTTTTPAASPATAVSVVTDDVVQDTDGGCPLPQRLAHILSDFPTGCVLSLIVFIFVPSLSPRSPPSIAMIAFWQLHYVQRGLMHPLCMRYSARTTPLSICAGGFLANAVFAPAVALHLALTDYPSPTYFYDPRFVLGTLLFLIGYAINRWADWRLRSLRTASSATPTPTTAGTIDATGGSKQPSRYFVPRGGLFEWICCPGYFGELLEWCGFALLSSSVVGVLWVAFAMSTFLPRSRDTRRWYASHFDASLIPRQGGSQWKALIPFVI